MSFSLSQINGFRGCVKTSKVNFDLRNKLSGLNYLWTHASQASKCFVSAFRKCFPRRTNPPSYLAIVPMSSVDEWVRGALPTRKKGGRIWQRKCAIKLVPSEMTSSVQSNNKDGKNHVKIPPADVEFYSVKERHSDFLHFSWPPSCLVRSSDLGWRGKGFGATKTATKKRNRSTDRNERGIRRDNHEMWQMA